MFIDQLLNQTSVPALGQVMQFAAARHELLVNNIANIDTPGYTVRDLSVSDFQEAMAKAIKSQRAGGGQLMLRGRQVRTGPDGRLTIQPQAADGFMPAAQDHATRQIEREQAALWENTMTFNVAAELLRVQFASLKQAIRQKS